MVHRMKTPVFGEFCSGFEHDGQTFRTVIPAGVIGGGLYLVFQSELALALGIIVANVGFGFLLLGFSGKLFSYIEMREFDLE